MRDGVITRGKDREEATSISITNAYEEIVDFIAAGSSPASVIAFRPSEAAQVRVSVLILQEKTGGLDATEKAELDRSMQMEHLMHLAKARARKFLTPSAIMNTGEIDDSACIP